MYKCWRCKGDTPNIRKIYLSKMYSGKYPEEYTSLCDKCNSKLDKEIEFENEQHDDDIICPACLTSFQDDGTFYESNEEKYQCEFCGAWFKITAEHGVTYTTKRVKNDEAGGVRCEQTTKVHGMG